MNNLSRRNDPFTGITGLHSQLDDLFNSFFSTALPAQQSRPTIDMYTEDDKALVAEVHAPGFGENDLTINVNDNMLEILGEKHSKEESEQKKRNYMVRESHNSFYRSIALPKQADTDKIEADYQNGVLRITIPFKALPTPKRVAINWGGTKGSAAA